MVGQTFVIELAVGDKLQAYMYTFTGLHDKPSNHLTQFTGILLKPVDHIGESRIVQGVQTLSVHFKIDTVRSVMTLETN